MYTFIFSSLFSSFLRFCSAAVIAVLLIALGNCPTFAQPRLKILASTFPVWIFTRNIVQDDPAISLELLVPSMIGCPHEYSLTPQDRQKIAEADVIILNGLGLESFLLKSPHTLQGKTVIEAIPPRDEASARTAAKIKSSLDPPDSAPNPHQFSSPLGAADMTHTIATALASRDPAGATIYHKAADSYCYRLEDLAKRLAAVGRAAINKGIVLQHDSLSALARDAGLEEVAVLEEEDQPPTASDMIKLAALLRSIKPRLLAMDPQYPDKIPRTLSRETGIPYAILYSGAAGPTDAAPDWYENIMYENIQTLEFHFVRR